MERGWLIILAFVIQMIAILLVSDPNALVIKKAVIGVTAAMLLLGILPNLRWWAFRVFALGFVLNTLVMSVNGGLMPVSPENHLRVSNAEANEPPLGQTPAHSKNVLMASDDTKLSFLSDVVYVSIPQPKVYSIGDLFLVAGVAIFAIEIALRAMIRPKKFALILKGLAPTRNSQVRTEPYPATYE